MTQYLGNEEPGELGPGVLPLSISDVTCVGKEHLEEDKELSSCGYSYRGKNVEQLMKAVRGIQYCQ